MVERIGTLLPFHNVNRGSSTVTVLSSQYKDRSRGWELDYVVLGLV